MTQKQLENEIIKLKKRRYNAKNPIEQILSGAKIYELMQLLK
jgi:hypothetical protein